MEGSGETGSQISAAEQGAEGKQTEVTFSATSLQGASCHVRENKSLRPTTATNELRTRQEVLLVPWFSFFYAGKRVARSIVAAATLW